MRVVYLKSVTRAQKLSLVEGQISKGIDYTAHNLLVQPASVARTQAAKALTNVMRGLYYQLNPPQ